MAFWKAQVVYCGCGIPSSTLHFPTSYSCIQERCIFSKGVNITPFAANPDTPAAHKHCIAKQHLTESVPGCVGPF